MPVSAAPDPHLKTFDSLILLVREYGRGGLMARRVPALSPLREFLRTEAGGGVLQLAATVAALAWANSPWAGTYRDFWHTSLGVGPGSWYLVVPVIALANAGVPLGSGALRGTAGSRLTWAVVLGLVVGKVLRITALAWAATRALAGRLPPDVGRLNPVLGASALGGIGFTVSLFTTGLALTSETLQMQAKIGILAGSVIAALVGVAILLRRAEPVETETVSMAGTAHT